MRRTRLNWTMACCAAAAAYMLTGATQAHAADTVPRAQMATQSRTLGEMKPGEQACTFLGWSVSREGHVWLRLTEPTEPMCVPSVNHALVLRTEKGWAVMVKAPVPVGGWDAEYQGSGRVRAGWVEVR